MIDYHILEQHVKAKLAGNNNGHGYDHAWRVVKNVRKIAQDIDCNLDICLISAYVHDLIDRKVVDDQYLAISELEGFLTDELKLSTIDCNHVLEICNTISYSKNAKLSSVEAKVVQDADRLDALGAIGIARTIEYSASIKRPVYIAGDRTDDTAIGHFHTKLYKLIDLMNFEVSKQIAQTKMEIMYQFEQQFIEENA
ncbi:HD domain-containing protein [Mollicutes bacterium LVI A0039]|nr:HD domain-containing protein [Mollicutes bacterium LVI A0039]